MTTEDVALGELADLAGDGDVTLWLDLCSPSAADLAMVGDALGIHELAVANATVGEQRPKLVRYDGHLFLDVYAVRFDAGEGSVVASEVAAFITANTLVTVRKDDQFDVEPVLARWDESPDLAKLGVGFLLHGLLNEIVDSHFRAVQALDDELELVEDNLFLEGRAHDDMQRRTFALRKGLVLLRRVVLPMREAVNTLMRRDLHVVEPGLVPYYQDIYDQVLRATEWTESLRDLVTTIMETRLTIQGNRLNTVMKKVTSWAAIIAVPTAVTGFYGQNVPFPGYAHAAGFYTSTAAVIGLSALLFALFRRWDWL